MVAGASAAAISTSMLERSPAATIFTGPLLCSACDHRAIATSWLA
jgi:hypothetical protein